jgi:hypothetical protein
VGVVIVAAERHKKETEVYLWMLPHVYCYKVLEFSNGVLNFTTFKKKIQDLHVIWLKTFHLLWVPPPPPPN